MQFSERMLGIKDVPQEVAAGQVGAVRLAARSVLAAAVQKVAEDGHLSAAEKQTLSALSDVLSPAEGEGQDHPAADVAADAKLDLTKPRPIPISRGMGKKLTGNRNGRDAI